MPEWRITPLYAKRLIEDYRVGAEVDSPGLLPLCLGIYYQKKLAGLISLARQPELGYELGIGFFVAREYIGRGFAREAIELLLAHCFRASGIKTVYAFCDRENSFAAETLLGCGFEYTHSFSYRKVDLREKTNADAYIRRNK